MRIAQVDVAIIGAGTAGLAAYRAARTAGATAMIIEGGPYGTTCARVGCMPSKLLIAAAEAAHAVAAAPRFGVHHDGVIRVDGRVVMDRVRRERDRFVDFVLRDMDGIPETERMRGHASFVDDHTLDVGGNMHASMPKASSSQPARVRPARSRFKVLGRAPHRQRRRVRLAGSAEVRGRDRSGNRRPGAGAGAASPGGPRRDSRPRRSCRPDQRSGNPRLRDRNLQTGIHPRARRQH